MVLLERSLISIKGLDSKNFLQGLITQDIEKALKEPCFSLMLNHKGFIEFDFFIFNIDDIFYIDIENTQAKKFIAKLKIYKLKSKVEITLLEDFKVYAIFNQDFTKQEEDLTLFADVRHKDLGLRLITTRILKEESTLKDYKQKRYTLAIAEGQEIEPNKAVALEWGFEELNAICFNKGCYLGQELITASKRKLVIRKRLLSFSFTKSCEIGDKITNQNGDKAGVVKYFANNYCLALVKMSFKDGDLSLNSTKINLIVPSHVVNYSLD